MLNENGSVNATFQPRPDGAVNALLAQPDGKVIVGGAFTNIAGAARRGLARFNADGTLDAGFTASSTPAAVTALALQPDGKVLVGGAAGGVVRLNANGSADATFAVTRTDSIRAIAIRSDGQVYIMGDRPRSLLRPTGARDPRRWRSANCASVSRSRRRQRVCFRQRCDLPTSRE